MEKPNGRHTLPHTHTHTLTYIAYTQHSHTCNTIVGCCTDLNTSARTHTHAKSSESWIDIKRTFNLEH